MRSQTTASTRPDDAREGIAVKAPQRRAPPRRQVDGVLLLDKPPGLSSNAALQHAKRLFNAAKAGHTGTLDPLATGLLPICFGEATKFAQLLLDADKAYSVTIRLGQVTTTGDAEGEITLERPVNVSRSEFETVLPRFIGTIAQRPPRYAALKFEGRNYYEYAREGIDIPRAAREVVIRSLVIEAWSPPLVQLSVRCGKGTYLRALAEDLGEAVGCGAHVSVLRRTSTGGFRVADAVTLESLAALSEEARDLALLPADAACAALPRCDLLNAEAAGFREGRPVHRAELPDATYRTYAGGKFAGVADAARGLLRPRRLVAAPHPRSRIA
jgi:tRNA pseudouridine55 synthase